MEPAGTQALLHSSSSNTKRGNIHLGLNVTESFLLGSYFSTKRQYGTFLFICARVKSCFFTFKYIPIILLMEVAHKFCLHQVDNEV